MATNPTSTLERQKALAWIARQLRWERTLAELRDDSRDTPAERAA
jgi:hypothetical protein